MLNFILAIIIASVIGFICTFIYGELRYRKACVQDLQECPSDSDTDVYVSRISSFLAVRAWVCNMKRLQEPHSDIRRHADKFRMPEDFAERVYKGNSPVLRTFVRLCHALGCTVTIQQTSFTEDKGVDYIIASMDKKFHCTEYMINSKLDEEIRRIN